MIHPKNSSSLVIGLALFSMFFGSGNLIFPMAVGTVSQDGYMAGAFGFVLTAVLLPFLGVLTMVLFRGDYVRFFSCLGRRGGFVLMLCLLTFWVPLGSAPRCITLAHSALQQQLGPAVPLWTFSAIYSLAVFMMTARRNRVIQILGKVLTPMLLLSLATVFFSGLYFSPGLEEIGGNSWRLFNNGLSEGYNTQDLIASFFFSSSIIGILQKFPRSEGSTHRPVLTVLRASLIGITILGVVYLGLLYLGATYADVLMNVSKDMLLPTLAVHLLGGPLGWVAIVTMILACLTTSVALALVFTNFVKESVFDNKLSHRWALAGTTFVTFAISTIGFDGIARIVSPAMQVLYPTLILLIAFQLGRLAWRKIRAQRMLEQQRLDRIN